MIVSFISLLLLYNLFVSRIHLVGGLQNGRSKTKLLYKQPCLLRVSPTVGLLNSETLLIERGNDSSIVVFKRLDQINNLQNPHNMEQRADDATVIPKVAKIVWFVQ